MAIRRVAEWKPMPAELSPIHLWPPMALGFLAIAAIVAFVGAHAKTSTMLVVLLLASGPAIWLYLWPTRMRDRLLRKIEGQVQGQSVRVRLSYLVRGALIGSDLGVLHSSKGNLCFKGFQSEFSLPHHSLLHSVTNEKLAKQRHVAVDSVVRDFRICLHDYADFVSNEPTIRKCAAFLWAYLEAPNGAASAPLYPPIKLKKSARIGTWALLSCPFAVLAAILLVQGALHSTKPLLAWGQALTSVAGLGEAWWLTRYYLRQRRLQREYADRCGAQVCSDV